MSTTEYTSPRDTLRAEMAARYDSAKRIGDRRTMDVCERALWATCDSYLSMAEIEALRSVREYRAL